MYVPIQVVETDLLMVLTVVMMETQQVEMDVPIIVKLKKTMSVLEHLVCVHFVQVTMSSKQQSWDEYQAVHKQYHLVILPHTPIVQHPSY